MGEIDNNKKQKIRINFGQIIICIFLVVCLIQNANLKREIQKLEDNLRMRISDVQYDVNNISSNVTSTLQQESSLVTFTDYSLEGLDIAAGTADLVCEILPKEYIEGVTAVSVVCDEKEYPLTFSDGTYKGTIPVSAFDEVHIESAIMRDDNVTRTEELNWYVSPRYEYLPIVYADMGSTYNSYTKDGKFIWKVRGDVKYSVEGEGKNGEHEAAYFYACLDGKEIERVDITKGNSYSFSRDYEIPFGSTLILYVEVIDLYGLHHRSVLEYIEIDGTGDQIYDENELAWRGSMASLYDGEGNLLHSEHPEYEF